MKYIMIFFVLFSSLNLSIISATAEKKFVPLKEIRSRHDFWTDLVLSYFCKRCAGLYFATVSMSDSNKSLDKGNKEKILQRAKNRQVYLSWAFNMWEAACRRCELEEKFLIYKDIVSIANQYIEDVKISNLTCGNLNYKDDLSQCKSFIDMIIKKDSKRE